MHTSTVVLLYDQDHDHKFIDKVNEFSKRGRLTKTEYKVDFEVAIGFYTSLHVPDFIDFISRIETDVSWCQMAVQGPFNDGCVFFDVFRRNPYYAAGI